MVKKTNRIPKFNNYKEEAEFWDSHSLSDYWSEFGNTEVIYKPEIEGKEVMTLRIQPSLKKEIKKIADSYNISTSALMRMWVVDKLKEKANSNYR